MKVLQMPDSRYPKLCFRELQRLEYYEPLSTSHNWAAQLREILVDLEKEELYRCENPDEIRQELECILKKQKEKNQEEDRRRITESSFSDMYKNISESPETEAYLTFDLRMDQIRAVSHLRTASRKCIRIYVNRCSYIVNTEETCSICNLKQQEDLHHILLRCPMYAETRAGIMQYIDMQNPESSIKNLLTFDTADKVNKVFNFITIAMRIRSFIRLD